MDFMREHRGFLSYEEYSKHHNAERSVCSKHGHWIKTDERGYIRLTERGAEYRTAVRAAEEAAAAGPSNAS